MLRALFEKTGNAVWISHLDLMRLFQRAFKRAGLPLVHTQGFNPRPSVSIALPLSVGVQSRCELLDFDLESMDISCDEIRDRLNRTLVDGVTVRSVYTAERKIRELSLLDCSIRLEYDDGVPENAADKIRNLFSGDSLILPKMTKNGVREQDILPMIQRLDVTDTDENTLTVTSRICCQNPTLNPAQIVLAIDTFLPELHASFSICCRTEIFDAQQTIFR